MLNKLGKLVVVGSMLGIVSACQTMPSLTDGKVSTVRPNAVTSQANHVQVGQISWNPTAMTPVDNNALTSKEARVIFIRSANSPDVQASTNIGINGQFLTSLHVNNYAETRICSGAVTLSALPTGVKSNNLVATPVSVNLQPQSTAYYLIDVNPTTQQPSINALSAEQAQPLLVGRMRQTHQVNRVAGTCK